MSALRKQMDGDLVVRGMAVRTREAYLGAVAGLAKYYGRRPDRISEQEVQKYLLHLIEERKLAWSSCNIAAQGLRFFYRVTLKRREVQFAIPRARAPQKLPEILAREEVAALLQRTLNPKHRAILMTTYAAGLRVSEVCKLKLADIDSARMTLRVEQGKGAKDRYTLLSPRLLVELRRYWAAYRPARWLFPMRDGAHPIDHRQAQKMFYAAKARAGIRKRCGIHGLRHAFATHLLEAGVDIHTIQRLMGHGHISSTLRYFHLARKHLTGTTSPLELLRQADTVAP
jgi:integrase/recombinase XerD